MNKVFSKFSSGFTPETIVMRLIAAWCVAAVFFDVGTGADFMKLASYAGVSLVTFAAVFAAAFAAMCLFGFLSSRKKGRYDRVNLAVCYAFFVVLTLSQTDSFYIVFVLIALTAVMIYFYASRGWLTKKKPLTSIGTWGCILAIAAVFFVVAAGIGVLRYKTYSAPNYDFGIFCQMFRNMKETGLPVTTCERDGLLSHFAVHISPIFYLLLPLYCIFPSPVTLQVCQALILSSAVLPFALIAKKYGLSNKKTVVLSAAFLFHPAIISGTSYDIHENCFLLPLLLWLFWAYETNRFPAMVVFTFLVLFVKEDAAVYIIFFAVWLIASHRQIPWALRLAVIAGVYFGVVLWLLKTYGNGVMSDRYKNYLPGGGTLLDAAKNMLADPAYVFSQLFLDKEGTYSEKMLFILQIFVPFAFIPFNTKKISNLLLLLPMVLMNLMTVYLYQYDIGFQYHFGVLAFIAYLTVINLSEMRPDAVKVSAAVSLAAALMLFYVTGFGEFGYFVNKYSDNSADYKVMNEALAGIPEDATVISSTMLLPHICDRDVIYEEWYHDEEVHTDLVLLDARYDVTEYVDLYTKQGYGIDKEVFNGKKKLLIFMTKEAANEAR